MRAVRRSFASVKTNLLAMGCGVGAALSIVAGTAVSSPWLGLVAVAGVIVFVTVLFVPAFGLLLTAFVVPIERLGRFGVEGGVGITSAMRVVGLLALSGVLLHMLTKRLQLVLSAPLLLYGGLFALGALSNLWAEDPVSTQAQTFTMIGNLMFLFLIANGVRDWPMIQRMVVVWLMATALVGLYQVYDWHFGAAETAFESEGKIGSRFSTTWDSSSEAAAIGVVRRAMGPTENAAVYGINLILTIPFYLYYMKLARALWLRGAAALGLILVLYNMLLTNTRAVMVFGALVLTACAVARLIRITAGRMVLLGMFGVAILAAAPASVWKRVLDASNYTLERASNLRNRFELWDGALHLAADRWLTGVGIGNRSSILRYLAPGQIDAEWIVPHNEFLLIAVELGIPGALIFYTFLIATCLLIHRSARLYRSTPETWDRYWFLVACQISVLAGIFFGVQVDVFHFSLKGWWLVAGLACALHELAIRPARVSATRDEPVLRFNRIARPLRS